MAGAGKKGKKKWGRRNVWPPTTEEGDIACSSGQGEEEKEHFWEEQKQRGRRERFFRLWVTVVTQAVI